MSALRVEVDACEAGFDPGRLATIGAHFRQYTDDGRMAGWLVLISRGGKVAHLETYGRRDETGAPIEVDTLFRMYSMTKPVTAVAAMICYEEGLFDLSDPVSKLIPSFAETRVLTGGSPEAPETEPSSEPVRIWHLLTHTAGLTMALPTRTHCSAPSSSKLKPLSPPARTSPDGVRPGRGSRSCSVRAPPGTTRSPTTSSAASSRLSPAGPSIASSPSEFSSRSA